jgi:hypothetical protein
MKHVIYTACVTVHYHVANVSDPPSDGKPRDGRAFVVADFYHRHTQIRELYQARGEKLTMPLGPEALKQVYEKIKADEPKLRAALDADPFANMGDDDDE